MSSTNTALTELSTGVMLVGHGTRDELGTEQFFTLGKRLAEILAPTPVVPCLLEFQSPTIPEAWNQLVESGANTIRVAPLLLFAAGHAKQDIPDLLKECQTHHPEVRFTQTGPLSRHQQIVQLACQRVTEATKALDLARTALVMVGRGSHDPCAQADMRILTELIGHRFDFAHYATSFYAMANPRLPEVLDNVATLPNIDAIVVQPHLLFHGRLYQAIEKQVTEAATRHPNTQFLTSNYLGPEQHVAHAISDRIGGG